MVTEEPQINQGGIEVVDNREFFESVSDAEACVKPGDDDYDFSASDVDDAPTKRSFTFTCGGRWLWIMFAAVLFTTFAIFLGGASAGIAAHNQAQAAIKENSGSGSGSKSGKCSKSSIVRRLKDPDFEDDEVPGRRLDCDDYDGSGYGGGYGGKAGKADYYDY